MEERAKRLWQAAKKGCTPSCFDCASSNLPLSTEEKVINSYEFHYLALYIPGCPDFHHQAKEADSSEGVEAAEDVWQKTLCQDTIRPLLDRKKNTGNLLESQGNPMESWADPKGWWNSINIEMFMWWTCNFAYSLRRKSSTPMAGMEPKRQVERKSVWLVLKCRVSTCFPSSFPLSSSFFQCLKFAD